MNWYKFDFKAYQLETYGLPDAEDLAYRRLMDRYYEREGPIPNNADDLCNSIGLDWDCIIPVLIKFFLLNEHDQWVHVEWQFDIERRHERLLKAAVAGKMGGRGNKKGLRQPAEVS
jgi:uncharacterized protein YdaU (DUF1376 family)